MVAVLVLVLVVVAGCGSPAKVTQAKEPSASEIVNRMVARYAGAKTYADHGFVTSGYGEPERHVKLSKSFDTMFVRGERFRFDLRDENDPQRGLAIWADGSHTYTRWWGPPRTTDDGPSFGVAIAVATKPSLGVVAMLAQLLRPDGPGAPLADARLEGREQIDERVCWVVSGKRGDVPIKLWIDRETFVLRRSAERHDDIVDIANFAPVLDGTLAVAQVPPPDFSDDYEEGSPLMTRVRALVNTRAPAFEAPVLSGAGPATLAGLAGRVVVVDFWATWCGPCLKTMPRLNEWQQRFGARGLRIVGLSSEDEADIKEFLAATKLDYTIAHDAGAKAARAYQVAALPMLVVIDKAGVVRYVTLGAGNLDAVEAVIENLLR